MVYNKKKMKFHKQGIFFVDELGNLKLSGYELLVRDPHPSLINPNDTFLDFRVFLSAFESIPSSSPFFWNINLYVQTFIKHCSTILSLLKEKENVHIELLEIGDVNVFLQLKEIQAETQLPIFLDDFGCGYSNWDFFFYLKPIGVKLDKIFTRLSEKLTLYTVDMVFSYAEFVVFEKIETLKELIWAYNSGFNYFQGFFLDDYEYQEFNLFASSLREEIKCLKE